MSRTHLEQGQRVEVDITSLGSRGEGLGVYNETRIFVPKSMPGDRVQAELHVKKRGQWIAKLVNVISPSSQRRDPACSHFEICGGCDLQHIPYPLQVEWKRDLTRHWINRSPLAPFLKDLQLETLASPKEFHYRHRVRVQIENAQPAYFLPQSREPMPFSTCPVLTPTLQEQLIKQAESLGQASEFSLSEEPCEYSVAGHRILFDSQCFTQANLAVNQELWKKISNWIRHLEPRHHALDLYCGVGNFSVGLQDHFKKVTAVEANPHAIRFAQKNSDRIEWIQSDVRQYLERHLPESTGGPCPWDLVLLDPSREGALESLRILLNAKPRHIIYVSCQLDSLIRDLQVLLKSNQYQVDNWTVVDLLPQTRHIESLVFLRRSPNL